MKKIQKGKQKRRQNTSLGWLQSKVVHFLCRNPIFCKVVCIYMLLTCHKNNNFPNLWLNLDCHLEEDNILKKIATYVHQIYSNGF
jgi:hypothetical protein